MASLTRTSNRSSSSLVKELWVPQQKTEYINKTKQVTPSHQYTEAAIHRPILNLRIFESCKNGSKRWWWSKRLRCRPWTTLWDLVYMMFHISFSPQKMSITNLKGFWQETPGNVSTVRYQINAWIPIKTKRITFKVLSFLQFNDLSEFGKFVRKHKRFNHIN